MAQGSCDQFLLEKLQRRITRLPLSYNIYSTMLPYNICYKAMMVMMKKILRLQLMMIRIERVHYQIGICNEHLLISHALSDWSFPSWISLKSIKLKIIVKTSGKKIMNNSESILHITLTEHQANMHMQMCIRSIIASTMWVIFNV